MSVSAFRSLLEAGDVDGLRAAWKRVAPHLPQPETREQAEIVMHRARTETASVAFQFRAWSHRWLSERALPSGLPDELRPKAERLYPVIAEGVGICVKVSNPIFRPAAQEVERAMADAVEEAYADGRRDPAFVTVRMREAREKTYRALFGAASPS